MRLSALTLLLPYLCGLHAKSIVSTSYGQVEGLEENGRISYKGVPFAKPPVGNLRWALPQSPDPWSNVLETKEYKPACMSNSSTTSTPQKLISEDCLYINVFTSQACLTNKCPVIVYFHGGAFNLDSATMFPDAFIKERYVDEGVVFAIPAFRLGVFGNMWFGPTNNVLSENLVMFDAVQALSFVHKEIHNFGGDPTRVTIMGHSSGGTMVDVLSFSKMVDPELKFFQQQIVLSAPGMFGNENMVIEASYQFASRVGCLKKVGSRRFTTDAEIIRCMRQIPAADLIRMQRDLEDNEGIHFTCIIRGSPFMSPDQRIEDFKKNAPVRKMLVGVTEHEFRTQSRYQAPYLPGAFMDFSNREAVSEKYSEVYANGTGNMINSDSAAVFISAATYAEGLANAGGDVYLFETRQDPYSFHVSDMEYFIGIHRELKHTSDQDILDSFYSEMLVNFTKYGEPSPYWEKYDSIKDNFLALEVNTERGIGPKMEYGFHQEEKQFWLMNMTAFDNEFTIKEVLTEFINPRQPGFDEKDEEERLQEEYRRWPKRPRTRSVAVADAPIQEAAQEPQVVRKPARHTSGNGPFWFVPPPREERNIFIEILEVIIGFVLFIAFLGAINMFVETVKTSCREEREQRRQERTPVLVPKRENENV